MEVIVYGTTSPDIIRDSKKLGFSIKAFVDRLPRDSYYGYPIFLPMDPLIPVGLKYINNIQEFTQRREKIDYYLRGLGREVLSFIDPKIDLETIKVGDRVYLFGCSIGAYASVGEGTVIRPNAYIAHESKVGKYCFIGPGASVLGLAEVGDYSFIGAGSIILPKIIVAPNTTVGAGAVVNKNVKGKVVGVPARQINSKNT